MHDQHAIQELIERLSCLEDVREVRVRAGPALVREALEQAYALLTAGTPLEGSRLVVEERREERGCESCGSRFEVSPEDVAGHAVLCPTCGQPTSIGGLVTLEVIGITWGATVTAALPVAEERRVSPPRTPARTTR